MSGSPLSLRTHIQCVFLAWLSQSLRKIEDTSRLVNLKDITTKVFCCCCWNFTVKNLQIKKEITARLASPQFYISQWTSVQLEQPHRNSGASPWVLLTWLLRISEGHSELCSDEKSLSQNTQLESCICFYLFFFPFCSMSKRKKAEVVLHVSLKWSALFLVCYSWSGMLVV